MVVLLHIFWYPADFYFSSLTISSIRLAYSITDSVTNLGVSDQLVNTTHITFNKVYWASRALDSASRESALKPIIYISIVQYYIYTVGEHLQRVST